METLLLLKQIELRRRWLKPKQCIILASHKNITEPLNHSGTINFDQFKFKNVYFCQNIENDRRTRNQCAVIMLCKK